MTLIAGIFSRQIATRVNDDDCDVIRNSLSRRAGEEVTLYRDERCMIAKVDIGAYGAPAFRTDPGGSIAMLAGDPLLESDDPKEVRSRADDLVRLHQAWDRGRWDLCAKANGVYCAVHYQPCTGRLSLIADKLGIRPVYYWIDDGYVVFSTALRVLEDVRRVPKRMDVRAVTEMKVLGVPLGARTPYADISLLRAGEVVTASFEKTAHSCYWRWDQVALSPQPETRLLEQAYSRFAGAVDRRLGEDTSTVAFLTGGLDSRCIVTELRKRNVTVHTYNFARAGTQEQLFGKEYARRVGAIHREADIMQRGGNAKYAITLASELEKHPPPGERPGLVWSGDGGSIGLGHVRVSPKIVDLLRAGRRGAAVDTFLAEQQARLPLRMFRTPVAALLDSGLKEGVCEELDAIACEDPGRAFHLFLMLNDQRRHLVDHFEHIDLHRLEYHLPFFDSSFIELIVSTPLDICLQHKFYVRWLGQFPEVITSVPWQAYPGHEPCPLPVPPDLGYQWDRNVFTLETKASRRRDRMRLAREVLESGDFPDPILSKGYIKLALWAYRMGLRDYGYVFDFSRTYHAYWNGCNGEYVLPTLSNGIPAPSTAGNPNE